MLSPLHRAVIAGYDHQTAELLKGGVNLESKDPLGFTAIELAKLLGSRECQRLLGYEEPKFFKVKKKGKSAPENLSLEDLEQFFNLTYRPFVTFQSYNELKEVIANCPYILRCSWIAKENHRSQRMYGQRVAEGKIADVYVKWIDPYMEYGLFADEKMPAGTFVGEYAGLIRRLFRNHPEINSYCMQYPTKWWNFNYYVVDALNEGNLLRFANHSDDPNMEPVCLVDRGLLRMILVTRKPVEKDEQLMFNYGYDLKESRMG